MFFSLYIRDFFFFRTPGKQRFDLNFLFNNDHCDSHYQGKTCRPICITAVLGFARPSMTLKNYISEVLGAVWCVLGFEEMHTFFAENNCIFEILRHCNTFTCVPVCLQVLGALGICFAMFFE